MGPPRKDEVSGIALGEPVTAPGRHLKRSLDREEGSAGDPRWGALALCLVAGFMTLLDVSIVNVALPTIRTGLGAGASAIQWIVAGYALAFGIGLVPAGRVGDARSRRGVFAFGLGVFTLASAACGAAPTATWLVAFRIIQGLGAGIVSPQVSGFIQTMFKGRERAKAFGLFGMTVGISTAIGPLLGGVLVNVGGDANGWRLVFYVNVPVGIAALLLVRRLLPAPPEQSGSPSLDPVGVLLFSSSVLLAMYPLVEGGESSLSSRSWWLLAPAAVLLILFVAWERRWNGRGRETLIELRLAKVRSYVLGVALGTVFFAGFTSIFLVLTLYLQTGLGYSALDAGFTQTSFAIGSAVAAAVGGRMVSRFGRALVVVGLFLCGVGLVALDIEVSAISSIDGWLLAPSLFVAGFGTGLVISPNVTISLSEVDPRYAGSGSGMLQTAQRVGSAIGVALVLAQFFSKLASSHDVSAAFTLGLRTTTGFVAAALVIGLADLYGERRRRAREDDPDVSQAREPETVGSE
jgi:EmrB/QacA subfamily drug resistance transporter